MDIVEEIESEIYGATRVFKIPSALWEKGLWGKGGQRKDEAVLPYIHLDIYAKGKDVNGKCSYHNTCQQYGGEESGGGE